MILDRLLEKKDLEIYIDTRIKRLLSIKITQFPAKQRGKVSERIKGRILELRELKKIIRQSRLKDMSKTLRAKARSVFLSMLGNRLLALDLSTKVCAFAISDMSKLYWRESSKGGEIK